MFLGIEIGGTKLQLGVSDAERGEVTALERTDVRPEEGAEGIREQIEKIARPLIARYAIRAVGFGFGGPVDSIAGRTIKSHHVRGWDNYPLVEWCRETLGIPAGLGNDSDMAGLGEARFGAGRGKKVVFYTNVGSGIGGALCIGGRVYVGSAGVASEIGHVRPGVQATDAHQIVETASSGWAIAAAARSSPALTDSLCRRYHCRVDELTSKMVGEAAESGDAAALAVLNAAIQTYGWAIAQMITLLAPETVVVGGGVPLLGEKLFFVPLREQVDRYVFSPLRNSFSIVPAALGEEVVVHGALLLAKAQTEPGGTASLFLP